MPLAGVQLAFAGFFEKLGYSNFRRTHEDAALRWNPIADPEAVGIAASHEACARR